MKSNGYIQAACISSNIHTLSKQAKLRIYMDLSVYDCGTWSSWLSMFLLIVDHMIPKDDSLCDLKQALLLWMLLIFLFVVAFSTKMYFAEEKFYV